MLSYGSESFAGTVEVLHDGVWGSVCGNNWDSKDALVVCWMFGMFGFNEYVMLSIYT